MGVAHHEPVVEHRGIGRAVSGFVEQHRGSVCGLHAHVAQAGPFRQFDVQVREALVEHRATCQPGQALTRQHADPAAAVRHPGRVDMRRVARVPAAVDLDRQFDIVEHAREIPQPDRIRAIT